MILPVKRIQSNRPWLLKLVPDQDLPHVALQVGQFDVVLAGIRPVEMVVDPVYRKPVRRDELITYHDCTLAAFVYRCPVNINIALPFFYNKS